jgi:hypothetical protein
MVRVGWQILLGFRYFPYVADPNGVDPKTLISGSREVQFELSMERISERRLRSARELRILRPGGDARPPPALPGYEKENARCVPPYEGRRNAARTLSSVLALALGGMQHAEGAASV